MNDFIQELYQLQILHQTRKGRPSNNDVNQINLYKNIVKLGEEINYDVFDKSTNTRKRIIGIITKIDGSYFYIGENKYRFDKSRPFPVSPF